MSPGAIVAVAFWALLVPSLLVACRLRRAGRRRDPSGAVLGGRWWHAPEWRQDGLHVPVGVWARACDQSARRSQLRRHGS